MSFSGEVRDEIVRGLCDKDRRFACLYGIFLYGMHEDGGGLFLHTENRALAEIFPLLLRSVFHIAVSCEITGTTHHTYRFRMTEAEQIEKVHQTYQIHSDQKEISLTQLCHESIGAFFAGVFLCCGSVTDPNKKYHLEFNTPSQLLCDDLQRLMQFYIHVSGKQIQRKNMAVLYYKECEQIEDILTYMGAQQCTLSLMHVEMRKDIRNRANRQRNCDEANINKVVAASMRQIQEIQLIRAHGAWSELSPELQELAQLRLENPSGSFAELGEMLTVPIGRSGVNHRFQKISAIAEKLSAAKLSAAKDA